MKNILVIEDDPSVRVGITDLLLEEGFLVEEAENGRLGVQAAQKNIPDLIISDILMPELDGYGVLSELQKDIVTASIPMIFLSAKTEAADIRKGMNLGAYDYLTKPYKADDLLNAVNSKLKKVELFDKQIEALNSSITQSLPHELRTPLTTILGFSQLLTEDANQLAPEEVSSMSKKINDSAGRLWDMVEKFLWHSEVQTAAVDKKKLISIKNSVVHDIQDSIFRFVSHTAFRFDRGEDIEMNLQEGNVNISEDYLKTIIEELISNSIKFSETGSPIKVFSDIRDGFYSLSIKDFGIGILPEHLKNIGTFKQFERDKYFQNGVGIGLSLVKKLVSLHGGTFKIESEPGHHTTVTVGLQAIG